MRRSRVELLFTVHVIHFIGLISASQADDSNEPLHDCMMHLFPLPPSWTKVTLNHLTRPETGEQEEFKLEQKLTYDSSTPDWDFSSIDPRLPFTFFINGFNNDQDSLKNSYMDNIVKVFEHFDVKTRSLKPKTGLTNVIFVKWYVQSLIADGLISLVSTYYKTMANYEIVVDNVVKAMIMVIDHVEQARGGWESQEARSKYFSQFRFYGFSLGAHIISHAVAKVHRLRLYPKFGKLVGLDPSLPCFTNQSLGISARKMADSTNQLIILHTNLGFAGIEKPRTRQEIVINGGSFQPNCAWYNLSCDHYRASKILEYSDDHCQMVAYRCNKYEQFKLGACETCEQAHLDAPNDYGCILVNLNEQHVDQEGLFLGNYDDETRQLADEDADLFGLLKSEKRNKRKHNVTRELLKAERTFYYHVNTNPDENPSSHCLQHYQMRLLILNGSVLWHRKCPLENHLSRGDSKLKLRLFHENLYSQLNRSATNYGRSSSGEQELQAILTGKLHTGLLNYEGKPRVFVGATFENIDMRSWSKCLMNANDTTMNDFKFVLDMAFMSHMKKSIRHMYSSVLCGQWNPHAYKNNDNELILNLCKHSELTQVSGKIDELLRQVKFEHQYEPWHISLLDSLFSLYVEWDPLR